MLKYFWVLPLLPAVGAAINGLLGVRWYGRVAAAAVACGSMVAAFILALVSVSGLLQRAPAARFSEIRLGPWIPSIPLATSTGIGRFSVDWSFLLDPLAAVMILVVTGIGLLIHLYATAYMIDEPRGGYARFFCYLNLFCAFMLLLVLGSNFPVMFIGWEGVGLCSYLLIGFWYEKGSAANAGFKAFVTNRLGDWGFLLGILAVFFLFGTLEFRAVASQVASWPIESGHFGALSLVCLLLFIGATGKSAQIPLYVWLPDAMEGPTPVSALIHAATMVTAGVYMVARNAVLFSHAPLVLTIVAIVGALTALMAATIGLVQHDIKRVLAYSTMSQIGQMFLAAGVGAFSASIFHLMTHAFFKALLFLGSGAVIHAMAGEQDMRRMGNLRRYLPVTFVTMMVGALAMAGIPPLAGFFSKDEILTQTFARNHALWLLGSLTAFLTALYMFRLIALTFYGAYRGPAWSQPAGNVAGPSAAAMAREHGVQHPIDRDAHGQADRAGHEVTHGPSHPVLTGTGVHIHEWRGPHEGATAMTIPLMTLAVGAIVAGFVGVPAALGGANAVERFLEPSFEGAQTSGMMLPAGPVLALMLLTVLLAAAGIAAAWRLYVGRPELAARLVARWPGVYTLLLNKYYVDELYGATVIRGTWAFARELWHFDERVIDGVVNGWGWATRILAWLSHLFDKVAVDGLVNAVGWSAGEGSFLVRRGQTGLVQNYALLIVLGVCMFLTVYLIAR
jgi:NADH-quinone oxidoreductase subunit L